LAGREEAKETPLGEVEEQGTRWLEKDFNFNKVATGRDLE
jgi:hypothetical protein